MFENLSEKLDKAFKVLKGQGSISEINVAQTMKEIRKALLSADVDFKTAKKIKRRDWIEDYFLQGCAYANAHNVMFDTNIKQVVILMIDRDLIFKEFTVKGHEFDFFTNKWKQKIIQFNRNI